MIPEIVVKQIDEKTHGLYVAGELIGTSKSDTDARFHMYFLQGLFEKTFRAGEIHKLELEIEFQNQRMQLQADIAAKNWGVL